MSAEANSPLDILFEDDDITGHFIQLSSLDTATCSGQVWNYPVLDAVAEFRIMS